MTEPTTLAIDAARYFGVAAPIRVRDRLRITVVDRAFEPETDDLQRDWVASVAAPAFAILRRRGPPEARRAFATIGTGVGLDALAAIELLEAEVVGLTDLFPDVVDAAALNVRANLRETVPVLVHAGAGDLLEPLAGRGLRFDVIYENLPNLPIDDPALIAVARTAASFVPPRPEPVPKFVADSLLVLHHLALREARDLLAPGGSVISTLGARLPLVDILRMAEEAGYAPRFLTYGWKLQAVAEDVIGTYAALQTRGLGPFHFFEAQRLERAFAGLDPETAGRDALAIERDLVPGRLDAVEALTAHRSGRRIGHTVAVLESQREESR
ncbi:hypothetical protein EYW49_15965 [Siculibacillus lacustris]|uniref:Class I SAM-dependent methyltransferase n=1 Tax=Siculibacillus lacustris TaxID=1549641 RepID=A0A4Q9VJL5_9HYPH|nr:class I SAM-dependent methyltransferase [Siculibacillus lacustris]TBW35520.1 hypothetical protein EYW49_15965 [Siculibacillus lacustris]